MHFSGGLVLRTHMRMHGSWHIYRPGERWRQRAADMRVLVATADFEAVGFNIPVAEFIKIDAKRDLAKHAGLSKLGPDALDTHFDRDEAVRRLRTRPASAIADALLDQRLMAGLGNVFKSEVLFSCRISPFVTVAALDDRQLEHLVDTGRKLLQANVRTTSTGLTLSHRAPAHDGTRQSRREPVGLWARATALPTVRRDDRRAETRNRCDG